MNIIIIWQEADIDIKVYTFFDVTQEVFDKMKVCHGRYIGLASDKDCKELNWLSEYLVGKPIYLSGLDLIKRHEEYITKVQGAGILLGSLSLPEPTFIILTGYYN